MQTLVWARVPGDLVFTVAVVAFALFMVRALFGRGRRTTVGSGPDAEPGNFAGP